MYDLADRFRPTSSTGLLGGVHAIGRLVVEQRGRGRARGLATATFVSGYQGSPLGGVDFVLRSIAELRDRPDFTVVPAVNEEIAATSVWGSQLPLPGKPSPHTGTLGVWYGKAPGVDRSGDAFRHGNLFGASPTGGVLVLVGDDPAAKSSTIPSASEAVLASYGLPVLAPRSSEEIVELGLLGVALSRASGCWVALKIVTDVADGAWTVGRDFGALEIEVQIEWGGAPWTYRQHTVTRNADVLTYPSSGNISETVGTCYVEVTTQGTGSTSVQWISTRDNGVGGGFELGCSGVNPWEFFLPFGVGLR